MLDADLDDNIHLTKPKSIRLTPAQLSKLDAAAASRGVSRSAALREIIDHSLNTLPSITDSRQRGYFIGMREAVLAVQAQGIVDAGSKAHDAVQKMIKVLSAHLDVAQKEKR